MQKQPLNPKFPPNTTIKVIGLGGVGSIVARYLSIFAAAQSVPCKLVLIDGDTFSPSNSSRMLFTDYGVKSQVIRSELLKHYQDSQMSIIAVPEYVTKENAPELMKDGDVVICCLDNHSSRKLINDHCKTLNNIVLVSGGNDGVGATSTGRVTRGTYGNVQIYIRKDGKDVTPDLARYHPEIAKPKDKHPDDISCTEAMMSTPQIGLMNLMTAAWTCAAVYSHLCDSLVASEMAFDMVDFLAKPIITIQKQEEI